MLHRMVSDSWNLNVAVLHSKNTSRTRVKQPVGLQRETWRETTSKNLYSTSALNDLFSNGPFCRQENRFKYRMVSECCSLDNWTQIKGFLHRQAKAKSRDLLSQEGKTP